MGHSVVRGRHKAFEALARRDASRSAGGTVEAAAHVGRAGTVAEALDALVEDYQIHDRASLSILILRLNRYLRPAFGAMRITALGPRDISGYIARRKKRGAANATINRELSALRRALRIMHQRGGPAPCHIPKLPENNARQGFVELEQYRALIRAAPEHIRGLIAIAYHTGLRAGELLSIQRSQVDLLSGVIRLPGASTKNRKPRTVPIYGDMRVWIEQLMSGAGRWLFEYRGERLTSFRTAWRATVERAQMPGLLFHDLRRSAVRNLERAGVPRTVAMAISGHRTAEVYRRYDIVSERDLIDAARAVEEWMNRPRVETIDERKERPM